MVNKQLPVTAPCATAKAMAARGREASAKQGRATVTGALFVHSH
jgi:hypothetical protein